MGATVQRFCFALVICQDVIFLTLAETFCETASIASENLSL
jgi:hypothetical protein